MPTNFQKAKRRVKLQNGNWSDPISYATSSESVELTDGTNLQTKIDNLGTVSTKDVATSGDASANQVVMGNDTRLTNARPASDVSAWAKASTKPTYTASEVGAYTKTESDNKYVVKETGKGLSTNDYTTADKNKLAGIEAEANKTVVDSAMSDSSTNPLQNKVITKELEGAKTATGNPLTITDAAPVNAVNLSMDLEPIQDMHGYDHPWVGGAGKNKLPMTVDGIKAANTEGTWSENVYTIHGITYTLLTDTDNNIIGIKANGTSTVQGSFARLYFHQEEIHNEYSGKILSGCPSNDNICYIRVEQRNSPYTTYANDDGGGATISSDVIGNSCRAFIAVFYEKTANNLLFYPMIRDVSADATYAPYSNICPISGRTEENIIVSRPNLYIDGTIEFKEATAWTLDNTETAQSITGISASGNVINGTPSTSYFWMHIPFSFRKNRTVYLKFDETPATSMFRISNSNGQYITRIDTKDQYTPSEDFDGFIDLGHDSALFTNYKIGIGYTSTFDIDAYNEKPPKTYTIQFGQTVYGAHHDVTSGVMTVDRAIRLVSECTWYGSNGEFYTDSVLSSIKHGDGRFDHVISSVYETQNVGTYSQLSNGGISVDASGYIQLKDSRYSTESDFKTNMGTTQLVYELATPFTIDLTPTQIKLLENTNTIYTDYESDTITLEYQPNNAIGEVLAGAEIGYDAQIENLKSTTMKKGDYITAGQLPGSILGTKATAEGYNTVASSSYVHAEGFSTSASGQFSHAEGIQNVASGQGSHAEGYKTSASEFYSHAEGGGTIASGQYSHAEGAETTASGSYSHAEGIQNVASKTASHAEGFSTKASGANAHAEGSSTKATGDYSHAEGYQTSASGTQSHAEGYKTTASHNNAHAEGSNTIASGLCSHTEGFSTAASNYASHAGGHYNAAMTTGGSSSNTTGTAFAIGNGVHTSALSNAFSVQYNGVVKAASTITASTTADYAEFFEWFDENSDNEDRVGLFVTNSEEDYTKIRIANSNDDYILGIVSGDPFVLGNGDCDVWNGMMIRDDFGRVIYEPAQKYEINPETGELEPVYDDEGNPVYEGTKPVYNPEYDPTIPYISRFDRPEWSPIGMLGVLRVYDDGTCEVGGYCTVGEDGKATKVNTYDKSTNCYKVIERITDDIIKVIFR